VSKSTAFASQLQALTFDVAAVMPAWVAQANFVIALHTADPGAGGTQSTSECNYTGYARVSVPRNTANWTQVGNTVTNALQILFPFVSAGSGDALWLTIGTATTGAGQVLHRALISFPPSGGIPIVAGATPGIEAGGIVVIIRTITEV